MEHFLTRMLDISYKFEDESEYYAAENQNVDVLVFNDAESTDSQDVPVQNIYDSHELAILRVPEASEI